MKIAKIPAEEKKNRGKSSRENMDPTSRVLEGYTAVLNQVNISNNNNKFYIVQILDDSPRFNVFTRYGRVGDRGVSNTKSFTDKRQAIAEFCKIFKSKTGNTWGTTFTKKAGKYMLMKMEVATPEMEIQPSTTNLPPPVSKIIRMIASRQLMTQTMMNMNIDTQRLPLGKISKKQIHEANLILNTISSELSTDEIAERSSDFWTLIPFSSGRQRPPLLDNLEQIKACSELLETLQNIEIAGCIMQNTNSEDDIYKAINLQLTPVTDGEELALLSKYVGQTHGSTHNYSLELVSALKIDYAKPLTLPNRYLLFHGSRMANFLGILSEGLRLPQYHQISNGNILGSGIYFADSVTKSFNYTCSSETDNTGFIVLCEVALGTPEYVNGPTTSPLPLTCQSRVAVGRSQPDPASIVTVDDLTIPCGHIQLNPSPTAQASSFLYNEYVIYNTAQYRFRYLLELKGR